MTATTASMQRLLLPMFPHQLPEEERRFRRILLVVALSLLALAVIVPFLPVFAPAEEPELPVRTVKLLPPPAPPEAAEHDGPRPQPAPTPTATPEPEPAPRPAPTPAPTPAPEPSARAQAQSSGLLSMRDSLSDLRDEVSAGSSTGPLSAEGSERAEVSRDVIGARAGSSSGGVDRARVGRGTGSGTTIAGREGRNVNSPVGSIAPAGGQRGTGKVATRTNEEIQLVFDRNKDSVYSLYNRALRSAPGLQGRVVLRLTIAPSGAVTSISVISSELDDPDLEQKISLRVKRFDFGEKDVPPVTITYPIQFFPS